MTEPRPAVFRDALQVSSERVSALSDDQLNQLMADLLVAQAYESGSPIQEVQVNTEGKAKDDGCDGWSGSPSTDDPWLGSSNTCWQFKAGTSGGPARLKGEVAKSIPAETLKSGGRFVVVASGSTNGKKGEDDRLVVLRAEAIAVGVDPLGIGVIGSERLTQWCNRHPAVASRWAGRPAGLCTLEDWSRFEVHQVDWQATPATRAEIEARRLDLDFSSGGVEHLHIHGLPGVGKSRFALELCRGAPWRSAVIYVSQGSDQRLAELVDSAAVDPGVHLTVVADEIQAEQLLALRDSVSRANGRVRLITIGHSPSPDPTRIPALTVKPLDRSQLIDVIKGWHKSMPPEHVDFVVAFADGYVRLARLAADAVAANPAIDVRKLLDHDSIRGFLDQMFDGGDRRYLHVVAVLTSVGWTDEVQAEGQAIAHHFGLDWNATRAAVAEFHRKYGIAPRGGRYTYISPTPLGIHLAVEAWDTYPELLATLPEVLPSEGAREAYYARLKMIASNPQAREFARDELTFFFRLEDFVDPREARRWSALSAADPEGASAKLLSALSNASLSDRKRIEDRSRRELVWTLTRIAWRRSSFFAAVTSLALLAEAENETWSNNASGEFVGRFQFYLGGTAAPYIERLAVIDELVKLGRTALLQLAVKALAKAGDSHATRTNNGPASDELPQQEWMPSSEKEFLESFNAAIDRLALIAKLGDAAMEEGLVSASGSLSMLLRHELLAASVAGFYRTVREIYPSAREPLRRAIHDIISREKRYWNVLSEDQLLRLENLHREFEESTFEAQLMQQIGPGAWGLEEQPNLSPIARQILNSFDLLRQNWAWLTSGEASSGWQLGEALAALDLTGILAEILPSLPKRGSDLRLLCSYLAGRRQVSGDEWYDKWVRVHVVEANDPALLVDVASRCGSTEYTAEVLASALREGKIDRVVVGQLTFGRWDKGLTTASLEKVLHAMVNGDHYETALTVLAHRLQANPDEINSWRALAMNLVTNPLLVRGRQMIGYYWEAVAGRLVSGFAADLAKAIFREQTNRDGGVWFVEHSDAAKVLVECAVKDPDGVWRVLREFLQAADAVMFTIGFPKGLLELLPSAEIEAWISEQPSERAKMIAQLVKMDFSTDETLASRVVSEFANDERLAGVVFSSFVSGSWWGPASAHWTSLAETLSAVAERTALPGLRRWALGAAESLRRMAQQVRVHEDEEPLRGY